eukprot:4960456-Prymnesium_polylepis.1
MEEQVVALEAAAREAAARGDDEAWRTATRRAEELRAVAVRERAEARKAQAWLEVAAAEEEVRRLKAQISDAKRA